MAKASREPERCPACEVSLDDRRICPRCGLACGKGDSAYAARPWYGGRNPRPYDGDNYAQTKADKQ